MLTYKDVFTTTEGKAINLDGTVFERPARDVVKGLIHGVGINDFEFSVQTGCGRDKVSWTPYKMWQDLLYRGYGKTRDTKIPTYKETTCCEEWKKFSGFLDWLFEQRFVDASWQLEKDLLVKGNKYYSPNTCLLVPIEVNMFLTRRESCRNGLIGAHYRESSGRWLSSMTLGGKSKHLGSFATQVEAYETYKREKEKYARVLAERYKDQLGVKAYEALINYVVDITD